jgi:molybdate transport system substrate-binding protein
LQGGAAAFTSCPILTIVRAGDILIDRKSFREYRNGASDGRLDPTNACLARGNRGSQSRMERPMNRLAGLFMAFAVALAAVPAPAAAQDKSLTVFAAASMKNALDEIDAAYTAKSGVKITVSYAASSALAKQIEQGAPADVFISADTDWMDYAASKKTINESSRVNLLGNSIVLIAPRDTKVDNVSIGPGFDLAKLSGDGRIATGDVKSVPVGKYAKAALEKLGSWQAAESKFAMADSVRAALTLVARGEAALGIVYSTDAKVEPGVKIVGTFPADSHPAILYPVAATTTAKPEASDYLAFLRSTAAKTIIEKYGFKFLVSPST